MTEARLYNRGECDYGKLRGVHFSQLKEFATSPKHYRHRLASPRVPTAAMSLGTHDHIMVLEPERFLEEFVVWESMQVDKKTGEPKQRQRRGKAWDAFQDAARQSRKSIIRDVDYEQAKAFKAAVRGDRLAMQYLGFGRPEVAVAWTDEETGVDLVGRIDWVTEINRRPCIVDLKGCGSVVPRRFCANAYRLCYHNQLAMYADGFAQATGTFPMVVCVAVEFADPHDVVVFDFDDDTLDIGRDEYRSWLRQYQECEESGEWLGVGGGLLQRFRLPAYALPDESADADALGLDWGGEAAE